MFQQPKIILNENFNYFINLVKRIYSGENEEKIMHDAFDELTESLDLMLVIQELISDFNMFKFIDEKSFINHALTRSQINFVKAFVEDIIL